MTTVQAKPATRGRGRGAAHERQASIRQPTVDQPQLAQPPIAQAPTVPVQGATRGRGRNTTSKQPEIPAPVTAIVPPPDTLPAPPAFFVAQPVSPTIVQPKPAALSSPLCHEVIAKNAVCGRYTAAGWTLWVAPKGHICTYVAINGARCHFIYVVHPLSDIQLGNNPQVTPCAAENNFIQNAAQNGTSPVLCAVTSRVKKTGETEYTISSRVAGTNQSVIIGASK